jgi:hypothetical protein
MSVRPRFVTTIGGKRQGIGERAGIVDLSGHTGGEPYDRARKPRYRAAIGHVKKERGRAIAKKQ